MYDSGQESCDSKQESENMNVLDKLVRDWTELLNLSMEKRQKPVKPPSPPVGQKKPPEQYPPESDKPKSAT
ncbi:hypothetical protein B5D77_10075 [Microcystis sp. MC19]|nr:hypothetical protein B5D77_10075 [Microcystis sp. MC19]